MTTATISKFQKWQCSTTGKWMVGLRCADAGAKAFDTEQEADKELDTQVRMEEYYYLRLDKKL